VTKASAELSRDGLTGIGDLERPEAGSIVRAGMLVTGLYLVSRILGWVRLSVLAALFGTGRELDAFYAAFRIPDLMFQLVAAGALSSALIPVIASLLANGEHARAWRVTSTVMNVVLVALLVLSVILEIAAPLIVPLITPGFSGAELDNTVALTRIMLLSPILLALGTGATSALNAQGRFGAAALAPIVYNVGIIAGAVLLGGSLGTVGLAIGVVAGSIAHFVVQLVPLLRAGFEYHPRIDVADPRARRTLVLMAPRAFGLGVTQLVFVVVTSVASTLGAGAITVLNFAFTLMQIPIGVLGVPLGAVVFPSLARDHATGSEQSYVNLVTRAVRVLIFVMIPVTGLAIVLRRPIVTILFEYGRFDATASEAVASTLTFFVLGLTAHAALSVLARAFYARQDTTTPVAAAILTVVVNSGLAIILAGPFGLAGIAASFTIAAWLEALVLLAALHRRLPSLDLGGMARLTGAAIAATVLGALLAAGALALFDSSGVLGTGKLASLGMSVVGTGVFGVVYIGVAALLRIPELPLLATSLTRLFRSRSR
jgi:putative peptidoglycan lipid II flippase